MAMAKSASLKSLASAIKPAQDPAPSPQPQPISDGPAYRIAETRATTRQISGHFPADAVKAFRVLAADLDMDVQELLGQCINMGLERYGRPERIEITSGRRKRI